MPCGTEFGRGLTVRSSSEWCKVVWRVFRGSIDFIRFPSLTSYVGGCAGYQSIAPGVKFTDWLFPWASFKSGLSKEHDNRSCANIHWWLVSLCSIFPPCAICFGITLEFLKVLCKNVLPWNARCRNCQHFAGFARSAAYRAHFLQLYRI